MGEKKADVGAVRVLTLNLWGRSGAWDERRRVLADGLRELRPDVVAFQEAVKTDGYDQAAELLSPGYRVAHHGGRADDGTGAAIASRWPLGQVREADLRVSLRVDPAHGWIGRVAAARVFAPDPVGPLLFVHHKPSWQRGFERERELQAVAAAHFVEGLLGGGETHVVLAGDLDAAPDAASVRFWRGLQSLDGLSVCYQDDWESARPGEPGRRIDYVMVRCGDHGPTLEISACELAFGEPSNGVWGSDHFGVVADLTAPAPRGRPGR